MSLGKNLADTLVTGETTAKKDSVFNSIRMVTNMKVCGPLIRSMDKVTIGEWKEENSEENIPEIGSKTNNTEEEHSSLETATDTTDIGLMECHKVKAE